MTVKQELKELKAHQNLLVCWLAGHPVTMAETLAISSEIARLQVHIKRIEAMPISDLYHPSNCYYIEGPVSAVNGHHNPLDKPTYNFNKKKAKKYEKSEV